MINAHARVEKLFDDCRTISVLRTELQEKCIVVSIILVKRIKGYLFTT
jgi:hypothetical protein